MGEDLTRAAPVRPGDSDLEEVRHRLSGLTTSRQHGGLNQAEEKEYDDLTRRELDLVEQLS